MDFTIKEYINNDDGFIYITLDVQEYENISVKVFNIFEQFGASTADVLITFPNDSSSYRFYKQQFVPVEQISREELLMTILHDIGMIIERKLATQQESILSEED